MHPRTSSTLEQLRAVEWFRNVGVRDTDGADVLLSWDEAVESCGSSEWEDLCLEAANQFRERLSERDPIQLSKWNEVVNAIKPAAMKLVADKTRSTIVKHGLPKVFLDAVSWDVVHLCMESEYAEVYPPGFYAAQAYWYLQGHFPCGWRGPFPEGGRLVIF